MKFNKTSLHQEVEDTLACSAFGEAGEQCPIGGEKKVKAVHAEMTRKTESWQAVLEQVLDDFACTAFHDQNMECPITRKKDN